MPALLAEIEAAFGAGAIYTPLDHGARGAGDWPSMDEMADRGRRVIVASAADYGEARHDSRSSAVGQQYT